MTQSMLPFVSPIATALSSPIARRLDPEPSKLAAQAVTKSGKREGQLHQVLSLVRAFPGRTSLELAGVSGQDRYIIARRLPELEKGGLVARGEVKTCSVGNRPATTWRATQ